MLRRFFCVLVATAACSAAFAASPQVHPGLDEMIARYARMHGIPERLVHRVVLRESRYNPAIVHRSFYGLMQITYATARSMGYSGAPRGLLDPEVNLTYAVPYLANAYKAANGNEDRAVALYAGGYYYVAKHKKLLGQMRNATSPSLAPQLSPPPTAVAEEPANPVAQLFPSVAMSPPASDARAQAEGMTQPAVFPTRAAEE